MYWPLVPLSIWLLGVLKGQPYRPPLRRVPSLMLSRRTGFTNNLLPHGQRGGLTSQRPTVGAQKAYDDVLRTACTQAALAGPGKYPARCDAVLHSTPNHPPIDPCAGDTDAESQVMQTECSD